MKELIEPILYVAFAIFAISSSLLMPMVVYMLYKEITEGRND